MSATPNADNFYSITFFALSWMILLIKWFGIYIGFTFCVDKKQILNGGAIRSTSLLLFVNVQFFFVLVLDIDIYVLSILEINVIKCDIAITNHVIIRSVKNDLNVDTMYVIYVYAQCIPLSIC